MEGNQEMEWGWREGREHKKTSYDHIPSSHDAFMCFKHVVIKIKNKKGYFKIMGHIKICNIFFVKLLNFYQA